MGFPLIPDKFIFGKRHIDNSGMSDQLLAEQFTLCAGSRRKPYLQDMLLIKTDIGTAHITVLELYHEGANNEHDRHHVLKTDQCLPQHFGTPGRRKRAVEKHDRRVCRHMPRRIESGYRSHNQSQRESHPHQRQMVQKRQPVTKQTIQQPVPEDNRRDQQGQQIGRNGHHNRFRNNIPANGTDGTSQHFLCIDAPDAGRRQRNRKIDIVDNSHHQDQHSHHQEDIGQLFVPAGSGIALGFLGKIEIGQRPEPDFMDN